MATTNYCTERWRTEACDLRTGIVRAVFSPVGFDFQTTLNRSGQGSLSLTTREVRTRDIWPHLTSVYISRIAGPGASPEQPYCEFGGFIEEFSAESSNTTRVGLLSTEAYLARRMIRATLSFINQDQNLVARELVHAALDDGIPLTAESTTSAQRIDRTYNSWDRKIIGEAIEELTDVLNGPDFETLHIREGGAWRTVMRFRDYVGSDRSLELASDRDSFDYGLDVDGSDHATLVDAVGEGEESAMLISTARDSSGLYPRFDSAPAWKDVSQAGTLQAHADGYLEENRDPIAVPSVTLRGLEPDPRELRLGDTVGVFTDFGAVTYRGRGRIMSVSWSVGTDEPETRTLELAPTTRSSEAVLNQIPTPPDCEGPA